MHKDASEWDNQDNIWYLLYS